MANRHRRIAAISALILGGVLGCGGDGGGGEGKPVDGVTVSPAMEKMKEAMLAKYGTKAARKRGAGASKSPR